MSDIWYRLVGAVWDWRVRRTARLWPDIQPGEWLLDLGMPTPRAVRIKAAYHYQQDQKASEADDE